MYVNVVRTVGICTCGSGMLYRNFWITRCVCLQDRTQGGPTCPSLTADFNMMQVVKTELALTLKHVLTLLDDFGPLACSHSELIWNYWSYIKSVKALLAGASAPGKAVSIKCTHTKLNRGRTFISPSMGFELPNSVFTNAKESRTLERAGTVMGLNNLDRIKDY
jgi:hypothetical protein